MITVDIILSTGSARESGSRTRKMTKLFRFHIRRKVKSHNARITGDAWMTASVMDDDVRAKKVFCKSHQLQCEREEGIWIDGLRE